MKHGKQWAVRILTAVTALTAGLGFCILTERVCRNKTSDERMRGLLESGTNEDILFVGNSQIAAGVLPMELWAHYGYTSYVLYATNNGIGRSKAMLELALDYTQPKLVFLSTDQYWKESSIETQVSGYHEYADAFPLSWTKIKTTVALYEDRELQKEILFPFLTYHNRWKELGEEDFDPASFQEVTKGSTYCATIASVTLPEPIPKEDAALPEGDSVALIEEFIQTCQSRGIQVVLLTLPFEIGEEQQRYFHGLAKVAEQYKVPYLNLTENCEIVNPRTDFEDMTHLNVSGAKKMTEYLGRYIQDNYQIPVRLEEYGESWGSDYRSYCDYKNQMLRESDNLQEILLMCRDDSINCAVYVGGASACFRDGKTMELLHNIGPLPGLDMAAESRQDYFFLLDYGAGQIFEWANPARQEMETSLGTIRFCMDADQKPGLYTDGSEQNLFAHKGRADVCIAVFDRWTGELICTRIFKTSRQLQAEGYEILWEEERKTGQGEQNQIMRRKQ